MRVRALRCRRQSRDRVRSLTPPPLLRSALSRGRGFVFALILCGCAGGRVPRIGDPAPTARDDAAEVAYQEVLSRVSDRKAIYQGLDTVVFISATWQSEEFVAARVARTAAFRGLGKLEHEQMLKTERDKLKDDTVFFFGVHANDPRTDDFDRSNSIWSLSLMTSEGQLRPVEVRRVGRATADMRSLYPYMDTFWVGYEVRFINARPPFKLKVASSLGEANLEYNGKTKE